MASSAKKRSRGSKASVGKRKRRHSGTEDEEPAFLSSKYAEPPTSKIYNSRFRQKDPAELFRKDLISAMKLPDNEPLTADDYWLIEDSWKPEWEKGVQVPVYPESLPEPAVRILRKKSKESTFKLSKKLICCTRNNSFNPEIHVMSYVNTLSERTCRYDMDHVDLNWLNLVNEDREDFGLQPLEENVVEQIIEEFEVQSYANFQEAIKSEEGLGVEYDEDAICDVCRSPDSQENNEMVFCDLCNICVHQICYGITKIPEGSWVCRTCALGIRPPCVLCPNRGGAMKTTRCGQSWAHVGCAVWIPEVSFFNFVKMEPITKISLIPPSRWALQCSICKEKVGACIQCSEKNCKVAFHVTCAFQEGLQMRASVKTNNADDDKLQAFCQKHSKKTRGCFSDSDEDHLFNNNKTEALTSEERANIRQQKIQAKEAEFYNYVNIDDVSEMFECVRTDIEIIYNYWKLKRRANWNRPLLPPKIENESNCMEENSPFAFLNKLVHRRQDLERARNLCYMAIKRERMSKRWIQYKEYIFTKQVEILSDKSFNLSEEEKTGVLAANFGNMAYDKKHTGMNGPSPNVVSVLTNLVGEEYVKTHLNGAMKSAQKSDRRKSGRTPNPYAKHYLNGLVKRSQRFLVDKQKKVSNLQNTSLDEKTQSNVSFQASDHLPSEDGCDSSKDLHDLSLDPKMTSQEDIKFECFNASDDAFVNLETYHSSDTTIKEEKCSETCEQEIEMCFPEISIFSQSSNDSTFATPSKVLCESLDESMSDNELRVKTKSPTSGISHNQKSKSCSGLEAEKQDLSLSKRESIPLKPKSKVLPNRNSKCKKNINSKLDHQIFTSEDMSNVSNPELLTEICISEDVKLSSELPVDNCIVVETIPKSPKVEISSNSDAEIIPSVQPKIETEIDYRNDDKLNSAVQCVIIKSEIPLALPKSELTSGRVKSIKLTETCDKQIKQEPSQVNKNGEVSKFSNKIAQNSHVSAKDSKMRPSSNKDSPLRTQSPTIKATENGLLKANKSNPKQNLEKSQVSSKISSKSKNLTNSHRASSPVNKQPSSSSLNKCQEKNLSVVSKNDESELSNTKDSSKETTATAPVPRKDMLRGYKIPKKPRTEKPEENSLDLKRGNTPLSPLPDFTSSSMSGYQSKGKSSWRKLEPRTKDVPASKPPRTNMNGNIQQQSSERLVLKLKKDTSDPESQRWKTDANNYNRNMGGWMSDFPALPPRLLPPRHPPPTPIFQHPSRPWPPARPMRNRGGFRQINMGYNNGIPYT